MTAVEKINERISAFDSKMAIKLGTKMVLKMLVDPALFAGEDEETEQRALEWFEKTISEIEKNS